MLLGGIGAARVVVGFLAAALIIRTYGIETFGEVAFATTYMMLGTVVEAFLFPKLKADIVNLEIDASHGKHSYIDTLNICQSINVVMLLAGLLLLLMVPVASYLYSEAPGVAIGATGLALCFLLSGGAYVEQVYVAQDKLVSYRSYDLLTWVVFLVLLAVFNNTMVPLPILVILFLGGSAVFRQLAAIRLSGKQHLKTNFTMAARFLFETKAASFNFFQSNVLAVGTSLLVNAFIKWNLGAKEFGEFGFLQKTVGAPFNLIGQNLGAAWRKHSELELKGETHAILVNYRKTIAYITAVTALVSPILVFGTQIMAGYMLETDFSLFAIVAFVVYGVSQLIFAWSSVTCSMHQLFVVQRNSYFLMFFGTCMISFVAYVASIDLELYVLLLSTVTFISVIYCHKIIKENFEPVL